MRTQSASGLAWRRPSGSDSPSGYKLAAPCCCYDGDCDKRWREKADGWFTRPLPTCQRKFSALAAVARCAAMLVPNVAPSMLVPNAPAPPQLRDAVLSVSVAMSSQFGPRPLWKVGAEGVRGARIEHITDHEGRSYVGLPLGHKTHGIVEST